MRVGCGVAVALTALLSGRPLVAQRAADAAPARGAVLRGLVYDSLARKPLAGAEVQLLRSSGGELRADSSFVVSSDEKGWYTFPALPAGRYTAGFFHPSIDSLGLDLPLRRLELADGDSARADLAVPSSETITRRMCGADALSDTTSLVFGFVRDARTVRGRSSAVVTLRWLEMIFGIGGIRRVERSIETRSRGDGWYAFCNVPVSWTFSVRATAESLSSGLLSLNAKARDVARLDVFVGASRPSTSAEVDSGPSVEVQGVPYGELRRGTAVLEGIVRATDGRVLGGARVSLWGSSARTVSSPTGRFRLEGLPYGSQVLDVRAVGFVPGHRTVHLLDDDAPDEATIDLVPLRAYLDTVRVTARRLFDLDLNGFERRRRQGQGHFLTGEEIEKRHAPQTTTLLNNFPRVETVMNPRGFGRLVLMRVRGSYCQPDLFLDGIRIMSDLADLDVLTHPDEIEGMEVYTTPASAPLEYAGRMSGCGSIVIWTRSHPLPKRR
jgi:hypothetical protein